VTRAGKEADKYKDDPTGRKSDADKPDEARYGGKVPLARSTGRQREQHLQIPLP
jgi:hypothetical protein